MKERQTLDTLQQRFEQLLDEEELDVDLLTELFAHISVVIHQLQLDAEQDHSISKDLVAFNQWLTTTTAQVDAHKLTVATQLTKLQKRQHVSKSYHQNQE